MKVQFNHMNKVMEPPEEHHGLEESWPGRTADMPGEGTVTGMAVG